MQKIIFNIVRACAHPGLPKFFLAFTMSGVFILSVDAYADDAMPPAHTNDAAWLVKFQSTYIGQKNPGFQAPYSGRNSFSSNSEKSYSFSATAFLGWRPWNSTEIYFNPEVVQGVPLSGLNGLGGVTNGEIQKVAGPNPELYRARLFLRRTIGFGGGKQSIDEGFNQFSGEADKRHLVLTLGNFALNDIFDGNAYSHDPRSQFLNWSIMDYGAWDFAADSRGFTWGTVAELYYDDWVLRFGRVLMPAQSNGLPLNPHIFSSYGDNLEIEHAHEIGGEPGKLRFLAYRNVATMAAYSDAIAFAAANGGVPDLSHVRKNQAKTGYGVSLEQNLTDDIGVFCRYSRDDGEGEEFAYAEIDRSAVAGMVIKGAKWARENDTVGLAVAKNDLSSAHRAYLAAGGLGFFLGDGQLPHYRSENILEAYYSMKVAKAMWVTLDYQHIANPGYNADRGPANVSAVRLHAEF